MESPEEQRAHDPPASLVPRLHMLYARPLQHNNPLLPSAPTEDHSACKTGTHHNIHLLVFTEGGAILPLTSMNDLCEKSEFGPELYAFKKENQIIVFLNCYVECLF